MGKKKIPTNQSEQVLSNSLSNAFKGLELPTLPAFKEEEVSSDTSPSPRPCGVLRIRRSTSHRGGKCVIVVEEFPPTMDEGAITELASALRKACSTGGTCKDRVIEVQGEVLGKVRAFLQDQGWKVKG